MFLVKTFVRGSFFLAETTYLHAQKSFCNKVLLVPPTNVHVSSPDFVVNAKQDETFARESVKISHGASTKSFESCFVPQSHAELQSSQLGILWTTLLTFFLANKMWKQSPFGNIISLKRQSWKLKVEDMIQERQIWFNQKFLSKHFLPTYFRRVF